MGPEGIANVYDLISGFSLVLNLVKDRLSMFLQEFASFYVYFEAIACHLITRGFVNPIPKSDEEGADGKLMDGSSGENCGFGEGEGNTDVTDQIDNLEQVEGLKV